MDRVIKSIEFLLGVWKMKVASMTAGVEGGKMLVWGQVTTKKFTPGEPSAIVEQTRAMHASIKNFMVIDFAFYLYW